MNRLTGKLCLPVLLLMVISVPHVQALQSSVAQSISVSVVRGFSEESPETIAQGVISVIDALDSPAL